MKTYKEYINEGVRDQMTPKQLNYSKLAPYKVIELSFKYDMVDELKYLIKYDKIKGDTKYLIEKYVLNLHNDEIKDYEEWMLNQMNDLDIDDSGNMIFFIDKDNDVFGGYNSSDKILLINSKIIKLIEDKFKLTTIDINLLIKFMANKYLNIKVRDINRLF
jgi:hypothetical protein